MPATVNGAVAVEVGLDTMSTRTNCTSGTLLYLLERVVVVVEEITPVEFILGDASVGRCTQIAYLDIRLDAAHAPITLRRVPVYVLPGEAAEILLGQPELAVLEYEDPRDWLDALSARGARSVEATEYEGELTQDARERTQRVELHHDEDEERGDLPTADSESDEDTEAGMRDSEAELNDPNGADAMERALVAMLVRARASGASEATMSDLTALVMRYEDVFRNELGRDPEAAVEPMVIDIIEDAAELENVQRARPFAPLQVTFLDDHIRMLLRMGVIRRSTSPYASPIVLAKKPDGTWRMCVDLRRINAATKAMRWPLPKIQELLPHLAGAGFFASFDLTRGFWQFPVAEGSRQFMAFVTHRGLYEFNRTVMGARNSAAHFQKIMSELLDELIYVNVMVYIDDILVYVREESELAPAIGDVLAILEGAGIKLKPKKCDLFCTQLVWVGHHVSAQGVGVNPAFVSTVLAMQPPTTAADLQQFVASCNWVRSKIPAYAELMAPLQRLLTESMRDKKKKTARAAARVVLADAGWGDEHTNAYEAVKTALGEAVTLAHLRDDMVVCLFPDASDFFWGSILTQVDASMPGSGLPVEEWGHEPLGFLSGAFRDASLRWGVPDKEAYAIKESCSKFAHLLVREKGFRIFTDHRNLRYIFNPRGVVSQVSKPTADRLERWAVFLRGFDYTIEHIAGELNVWADMLSRWAAGSAAYLREKRSRELQGPEDGSTAQQRESARAFRVRGDRVLTAPAHTAQHTDKEQRGEVPANEAWPSVNEVRKAQRRQPPGTAAQLGLKKGAGGLWYKSARGGGEKLWVPEEEGDSLRARIMVVAHAGAAGHRRRETTQQQLQERFWWPEMLQQLDDFLATCLLCAKTQGGVVQPRPLGEAVHGEVPGDALHMDYVSLTAVEGEGDGESGEFQKFKTTAGGTKGVLVLKDGVSGFVMLVEANKFDSATSESACVAWAALFGVPRILVSDGGTHFDNGIMKCLCKRFRATHHITTAYSPWANGAVERVMRELIRLLRTLLSEMGLPEEEYPDLLALAQATLNQTPSTARAGLTPAQLMLGRDTPRPLDTIVASGASEEMRARLEGLELSERAREYFTLTADAVQASWVKAKATTEQRHAANARSRERRVVRDATRRDDKEAGANEKAGAEARQITVTQFALGEFVLALCPVKRSKLKVIWQGPYRVVDTINEWVYVLEDVVTLERQSVHAQRLKFYHDASLHLTEDLRMQVAYDTRYYLEKVIDWRQTDADSIELRVRWLGFEANEDSWEPVQAMHEVAPAVVERYMRSVEAECEHAAQLLQQWGVTRPAVRRRNTRPRRK